MVCVCVCVCGLLTYGVPPIDDSSNLKGTSYAASVPHLGWELSAGRILYRSIGPVWLGLHVGSGNCQFLLSTVDLGRIYQVNPSQFDTIGDCTLAVRKRARAASSAVSDRIEIVLGHLVSVGQHHPHKQREKTLLRPEDHESVNSTGQAGYCERSGSSALWVFTPPTSGLLASHGSRAFVTRGAGSSYKVQRAPPHQHY